MCRGIIDAKLCVRQARSIPVRKDDEVLIVRGTYKGREGKVNTHAVADICSKRTRGLT